MGLGQVLGQGQGRDQVSRPRSGFGMWVRVRVGFLDLGQHQVFGPSGSGFVTVLDYKINDRG